MKTEAEIKDYLLGDVFCSKDICNTEMITSIAAQSTIMITNIEFTEVRQDCFCLKLCFLKFTGDYVELSIYLNGDILRVEKQIKGMFFPVRKMYKIAKSEM